MFLRPFLRENYKKIQIFHTLPTFSNACFGAKNITERTILGNAEGHGEKEFLCCFSFAHNNDVVLVTEDDFDVKEELTSMLEKFVEKGIDELDAYQDMLDLGDTPDILRKYSLAGEADAMEVFCREHGMLG